jgi:hypothetical protein
MSVVTIKEKKHATKNTYSLDAQI